MNLIIKTYRFGKDVLRMASEAESNTPESKIVKQMSIRELEEISSFIHELEAHGILEKIQDVTN